VTAGAQIHFPVRRTCLKSPVRRIAGLFWCRERGRLSKPEFEQGFAGNHKLLAFFGGRNSRASGSTGERADRGAGSSSRYPANEGTQSRATKHLLRGFGALSLALDLISTVTNG
jgi:hypothetical protein